MKDLNSVGLSIFNKHPWHFLKQVVQRPHFEKIGTERSLNCLLSWDFMFEYEREANPSFFKYIKFGSRMSYDLQKHIQCKRKN